MKVVEQLKGSGLDSCCMYNGISNHVSSIIIQNANVLKLEPIIEGDNSVVGFSYIGNILDKNGKESLKALVEDTLLNNYITECSVYYISSKNKLNFYIKEFSGGCV